MMSPFDLTFLIAVPLPPPLRPFTPLPQELVRLIFERAASDDPRTARSSLLVAKHVHAWVHPIVYETVEIFGLRRMINFANIFADQTLLANSVRNLTLYDDTTGDFVPPELAVDPSFLRRILLLCRGVRRLAVNYIRGIPNVEGPKPHELTIRRGLRSIRLNTAPFDGVTHLHCRYEQLMRSKIARLTSARLTHICFTHSLDFTDAECQDTVAGLLAISRLQMVIVEVAYHKWHPFEDASVRRLLAENPDERLFVRLSKHDIVRPYDRQTVFRRDGSANNVWDVSSERDWRNRPWNKDTIFRVFRTVRDRSLRDTLTTGLFI